MERIETDYSVQLYNENVLNLELDEEKTTYQPPKVLEIHHCRDQENHENKAFGNSDESLAEFTQI